ncbi:unnamed protein product [Spirodela intermedia]|uniref:Uncharacterized protein n=2 Tax=Spirodela intermedia TaxID=51605 RepID=A0A7I8L6H3_SPIIN|nr:unnamed protein product [Spirodela intermedia]CAA6668705.1 unnamed protein product [Spirodela intermedia]CAA7405599.1 unnamed protein product [Spirodela intermedia]
MVEDKEQEQHQQFREMVERSPPKFKSFPSPNALI